MYNVATKKIDIYEEYIMFQWNVISYVNTNTPDLVSCKTKVKKRSCPKVDLYKVWCQNIRNKANLRDLIAATGLVISNWIQIVNFSACVTVKFDGWPCKNIGHLSYATSSFVHHFVAIGEYKLELQSGNAQSGSN